MLDVVTARVTSPHLVGREAECTALRDVLKRARAGEAVAMLIGGEAGVGKTRLVEEFLRDARDEGAQILAGQCLELGEEGPPFAPFAAALRQLLRQAGSGVFAGHEQEFARLVPELGPVGPEATVDAQRGWLFELVAGLLSRLAAERPLVLVVEDLHWADRSTRDLIAFLVRSARIPGTALLCTYRSDELHRGHPLRSFLAELDRVRDVARLEVDRLDREGTGAILAALLGGVQSPRLIDGIHARAQGNPFFTEELAACGGQAGCVDIPDTLRDLLLTRVDSLPEPDQRVLRIAAAGGTRIGHELLAGVAELPHAELEDALRRAVTAQLLVADPDRGYEFRHALVREAVHDDLLPGEHARLHARYAAAIEAEPHLVPAGEAPAELAHHWHAANDLPRALAAAVHAAEAAGQRYAYAEKSRLLERALKLWEQVPDAGALLGMSHITLLEDTLAATVIAGDFMRALSLVRVALDEVDRTADPLRAARLLYQRAKLLCNLGKSDGSEDARRAHTLAASAPETPEQVDLLADLAGLIGWFDPAESERIARAVVDVAQRLDSPRLSGSGMLTLNRVCWARDSVEASLAQLRDIAETARSIRDAHLFVKSMVNLSDRLFEVGDYAGSAQAAADGVADAQEFGISRSTGAFLFSNRAEALVALGHWDEADLLCVQTARLDPPGTLGLHWLQIHAGLRLFRGQPGADELAGRALAFAHRPHLERQLRLPLHQLTIRAALRAGDAAAAGRAAQAGLDDLTPVDKPRYAWPLLAAVVRVAAAGRGPDPAEVGAIAARIPARFPAELAYAAAVRAELSAGQDAVPAWQATVAAWRADGQPYPLAQALLSLANSAAATDRPLAVAAVEEAGALAGGLEARPLVDDVATLTRRLGVPTVANSIASAPVGQLTERERAVVRLVSEGYSNSRIAEELYISPKTASVHVSRIIAKLSVTNRTEAAAVARRLGLL